jgi:hypothetical protein
MKKPAAVAADKVMNLRRAILLTGVSLIFFFDLIIWR